MIDAVEAFCDVGVEGIFGFMANGRENGGDRIMTGSAWTKSITVGFKAGFPFGFEGRFDQTLQCSIGHHGDAERSLLSGVRFGDPDPPHRLDRLSQSQGVRQREPLGWSQRLYPVDSRGFLPLIVLSHLPHG